MRERLFDVRALSSRPHVDAGGAAAALRALRFRYELVGPFVHAPAPARLVGITVRVRGLAIPDVVPGRRLHVAEPENVSAAHVLVSSCMDREQHQCQCGTTKSAMRMLNAQLGRFSITMSGGGCMA